ncbi:DUF6489 family protein [Thermaurantiacus sp.]
MKFEIEIEATPLEARQFLGLPDVTPLHDLWIAKMQELVTTGVSPADVERMMKAWSAGVPGLSENLEKWQQLFWSAAGMGAGAPRKDG